MQSLVNYFLLASVTESPPQTLFTHSGFYFIRLTKERNPNIPSYLPETTLTSTLGAS